MKQYNCKNCGAPAQHSYNHRCPYCNSLYDFNVPVEKTTKVRPEDLVNLKLDYIELDPRTMNLLITFVGYKLEHPTIYEFDGIDTYTSSVENYINPPKCGFCIEVPIYDLETKGFGYLMWIIGNTGIRPSEIAGIATQLRNQIERYVHFRC